MATVVRWIVRIPGMLLIGCVRLYQKWISPALPRQCRFTPTCSAYMIEAVQKFGFLRGGLMGVGRVLRCHPWHPGGHDPPGRSEDVDPTGPAPESPKK